MKKWKRQAAGLLSFVMVAALTAPAASAAQQTEGSGADTVTIRVENVPGGALAVEAPVLGSSLMWKTIPLEQNIVVERGAELTYDPATFYYSDYLATDITGILINGEKADVMDAASGEMTLIADRDMVLTPEFILQYDERREQEEQADIAERLLRSADDAFEGEEDALEEDESEARIKTPVFQTAAKRGYGSYKHVTADQFEGQLYDYYVESKEFVEVTVPYEITELRYYASENEKPRGKELEIEQYAALSEDGVLKMQNLKDGVYAVRVRTEKEGEKSGYHYASLYVCCNAKLIQAYFPLAESKEPLAEEPYALYVMGERYWVGRDSDTVEAALNGYDEPVFKTEASGYVDYFTGNSVNNRKVGEALDTQTEGIIFVKAKIGNYKLPVIEKPETEQKAIYIDYNEDTGRYEFLDEDYNFTEPVKNAFIGDHGSVYYQDKEGVLQENGWLESSKNADWYIKSYGTNGFYKTKKDENAVGKIRYFFNQDSSGRASIQYNQWLHEEGENGSLWYYLGDDGRAAIGDRMIEVGERYELYHFDADGAYRRSGWNKIDGELYFLDADGKPIKYAFAKGDDGDWYYLGKDGRIEIQKSVVKTSRDTLFYSEPGADEPEAIEEIDDGYSFTEAPEREALVFRKLDEKHKYSSVYYLLYEDGSINTSGGWEDYKNDTLYFGTDGKALQGTARLIDDILYQFSVNGVPEELVDLDEVDTKKPSKVAAVIEKLKLEVDEAEANTEDDAKKYVFDILSDVVVPYGYELEIETATPSNAEKAFRPAEGGKDGYWYYDATVSVEGTEDEAPTPSTAKRRAARVATRSDASKNRFYATAGSVKLTIKADQNETPDTDTLEELTQEAAQTVAGLSFTQEDFTGKEQAAEAARAAVEALLADGYWIDSFETGAYKRPAAGTKANPEGTDGYIELIVSIYGEEECTAFTFKQRVGIKAAAYENGTVDPVDPETPTKPGTGGTHASSGGSGSGALAGRGYNAQAAETKGSWSQDADGAWRFLITPSNTYAKSSWHKINGRWYYFEADEKAAKGWRLLDGKWYYLDPANCWMLTGWLDADAKGNRYYLNADGSMALGWVLSDGKHYYMNTTDPGQGAAADALPYGAMLRNTITPDGYRVGADGAWDGKDKA